MREIAQVPIGTTFGSPIGQTTTIGDLVSTLISASFAVAGIVVLFLIVLGGFYMIMGAGQENPEAVAKGKQAATYAVIGFVIIFVAYWIVRIIELVTGFDFITAPGL